MGTCSTPGVQCHVYCVACLFIEVTCVTGGGLGQFLWVIVNSLSHCCRCLCGGRSWLLQSSGSEGETTEVNACFAGGSTL